MFECSKQDRVSLQPWLIIISVSYFSFLSLTWRAPCWIISNYVNALNSLCYIIKVVSCKLLPMRAARANSHGLCRMYLKLWFIFFLFDYCFFEMSFKEFSSATPSWHLANQYFVISESRQFNVVVIRNTIEVQYFYWALLGRGFVYSNSTHYIFKISYLSPLCIEIPREFDSTLISFWKYLNR